MKARYLSTPLSVAMGITLTFSLLVGLPTPTSAATIQDQSNAGPWTSGPGAGVGVFGARRVAQVFRAGVTGQLTRITLTGCQLAGTLVTVTIKVYDASGSPPNAIPPVPLSTADSIGEAFLSGAELDAIPANSLCDAVGRPVRPPSFDVSLDSPAPVSAGRLYAFVVSTTSSGSGGRRLNQNGIDTYTAGNRAYSEDNGNTWRTASPDDRNLLFTTYVDVGNAVSEPERFELTLMPHDGARCTHSSQTAVGGTWIALPGALDCKPPAAKPNARLLGWATSPTFPRNIAERQVSNGWGAYETFDSDGQLTGVFIPAGGSTLVSAAGNLYPIWDQ